ncbi:SLC13 family permease [Bifidobacterium sp. ESL0763]|uniref:SLC13 family permease n=1 Tax=Bifidobacterium sp. ESL0763 TaxID=2983227 RepID=UPI0023F91D73|nr:SLC13 family permease [Bifidobacterium sp. ESL0763]MDF7663620.1 SLC13 family permease [Bifidobacterium sp. ESL0763]
MRSWIVRELKNDTILVVATVLAIISCIIIPPDSQYLGYIHMNTISQLVCLMLVVCGFQRIGVFHIIGTKLLHHVASESTLVITLVSLAFFSAAFITNDVALVTFIPFALSVLMMAKMEDKAVLVVTLMTVAANTGSMLTPIGNAHNLYLKSVSKMPTAEFLEVMGPYSLLSAVLLLAVVLIAFRKRGTKADFMSIDSEDIEQSLFAPQGDDKKPDEVQVLTYGAGHGGWRAWVYMVLFLVCILAVGGWIPLWLMCLVVFAAFLVCDRRAFLKVDWSLPLTFVMFFIFIGNMRRVSEFSAFVASIVNQHPMGVAIGSSQLISNVPTSILLSGFCSQWKELIIGTNLGGLGTLIASMASLISYQQIVRKYPGHKARYLLVYTTVNVLFLAVLVGLSFFIN